jgi:hypothetical protein
MLQRVNVFLALVLFLILPLAVAGMEYASTRHARLVVVLLNRHAMSVGCGLVTISISR